MYEIWRKSSDKQLSKNVHKCKLGQAFDNGDPYVKFESVRVINEFLFVCLFCWFTSQVNSYGHGGTVSSPNHTFS